MESITPSIYPHSRIGVRVDRIMHLDPVVCVSVCLSGRLIKKQLPRLTLIFLHKKYYTRGSTDPDRDRDLDSRTNMSLKYGMMLNVCYDENMHYSVRDLDSRMNLRILHHLGDRTNMPLKYGMMLNVRYDENMHYSVRDLDSRMYLRILHHLGDRANILH